MQASTPLAGLLKKNLTFKWENGWRLPTLKYFS